jgi:O-antigen/teichoic acid export membrane protein
MENNLETTLDSGSVRIRKYIRDPLFRNSLFIILASVLSNAFGLVFWMIAAKIYPKEDVGVATALISSLSLVILVSGFGLSQSLIRFFPERDKGKVFGTSVIITTLFAILFGVIFIAGVEVWAPGLHQLKQYVFPYLLFLAANSVVLLTGNAFIALRKAEYYFLQSLLMGSRIVFLTPLVFLGTLGIFSSLGVSFVITLIFSLLLLVIKLRIKPAGMDRGFLSDAFRFSTGNHVATLFMRSPRYILPVMVLNTLGAEETAYYYVVFAISSLLFIIPGAVSTSLFVEGSHGEVLKKTVLKSFFVIFLLLTPAVVVLYFFGELVLQLLGKDYAASGLNLLRLMALSSFFVGICQVYSSIKRIQQDMKGLILLGVLIFALLLGLSYAFIPKLGLSGVGYAWIISYGVSGVVVAVLARSARRCKKEF